jgi:hypothetical protein
MRDIYSYLSFVVLDKNNAKFISSAPSRGSFGKENLWEINILMFRKTVLTCLFLGTDVPDDKV